MKLKKIVEKEYKGYVYAVSEEPVTPQEADAWCGDQRSVIAFFDDSYYSDDFSRNIRHEWPDKSNEFWLVKGIKQDKNWYHAGLQPSADKELLVFGDQKYHNFICAGRSGKSRDVSTESSLIGSFKNKQFRMLSMPVEFDDARSACKKMSVDLLENAEEIKEVSKYIRDNISERSHSLWHVSGKKHSKLQVDDENGKVYESELDYSGPFVLDPVSENHFRNSNGTIKTPFVICWDYKAAFKLELAESEDYQQIDNTKQESFQPESFSKVNSSSEVLTYKGNILTAGNNTLSILNFPGYFNLSALFICVASLFIVAVVLVVALSCVCKKYKKFKANNTADARKTV